MTLRLRREFDAGIAQRPDGRVEFLLPHLQGGDAHVISRLGGIEQQHLLADAHGGLDVVLLLVEIGQQLVALVAEWVVLDELAQGGDGGIELADRRRSIWPGYSRIEESVWSPSAGEAGLNLSAFR